MAGAEYLIPGVMAQVSVVSPPGGRSSQKRAAEVAAGPDALPVELNSPLLSGEGAVVSKHPVENLSLVQSEAVACQPFPDDSSRSCLVHSSGPERVQLYGRGRKKVMGPQGHCHSPQTLDLSSWMHVRTA